MVMWDFPPWLMGVISIGAGLNSEMLFPCFGHLYTCPSEAQLISDLMVYSKGKTSKIVAKYKQKQKKKRGTETRIIMSFTTR